MPEEGISPTTRALIDELSRIHLAIRVLDVKVHAALRKLGHTDEDISQLHEGAESQLETVLRQGLRKAMMDAAAEEKMSQERSEGSR